MKTKKTIPKQSLGCLGWGWRILLGSGVALAAVLGAGYYFQVQTTAADFQQFPPPGQLVDIGGYRLHIFCQGEGSPTVVVDAGNGDFSLGWSLVQPEVSLSTRICVYDRAGYGWSDPGPAPRTAQVLAQELHALLGSAGIEGPYLLVGQSLGGLTTRMYQSLYPQEVAGMVLVEAGHGEQLVRLPADYQQIEQQQKRYLSLMEQFARFGILRLMGRSAGEGRIPPHINQLPEGIREVYITLISHPAYFAASLDELQALEETCEQVRNISHLGDLPLAVLSAKQAIDPETLLTIGLPSDYPVEQIAETWLDLQMELAGLSTESTFLVVEDSGHAIHLDQPELVVEAILDTLQRSRAHNP